jgi:hypothetical protein
VGHHGDVCGLFMLAYLYHYYLPALDLNDTECTVEGEVFEYQEEEDQGQADQSKLSKLVASLILVLLITWFITVYKNACLYCYYLYIAIIDDLASQVNCYHPHGWHLLDTYPSPYLEAWWLAS